MYYQTQQLGGLFGQQQQGRTRWTSRRMRPIQFAYATLALGARPFVLEPSPVISGLIKHRHQ
jgi:hypothetical protein